MAKIGRMIKESMVEELSASLPEEANVIVTSINRLSASAANGLRKKLYASKARLMVVKRSLAHRAVAPRHAALSELLSGSVGLVVPGEDVLLAAKAIVEFIKEHSDQLAVRGALIDGQLVDKRHVEELASLPPKPMLLAQVVATVEFPLSDTIFTIEVLLNDVMYSVEQAAEKKPAEAAAQPSEKSKGPTAGETNTASGASAQDAKEQSPKDQARHTEVLSPEKPPKLEEGTTS